MHDKIKWILCFAFIGLQTVKQTESTSDGDRRICGYGKWPICCPGWHNGLGAPCSIASCAGNCGERGRCVRPNTCLCEDRRLRFDCEAIEPEPMQGDQAANSCPENCNNKGTCESNQCYCEPGYTGDRCEVVIESACFVKLHRGLCVSPVQELTVVGNITSKMTREVCCNAFGIAWGDPCETCQPGYCGRGYSMQNGACRDINECLIRGVCRGGQCMNTEGSYNCQCPNGYDYDRETLECTVASNACHRHGHRCSPGGKCVAGKNGDYKCVCNERSVASSDRKSCIIKKSSSFDVCSLYNQTICQNGICIPRGNSYECICKEGFEPSTDRKSCRHKIDVCAVHRGYLCRNGECISMGRDFYCKCNTGFMSSFDRRRCINQCEYLGHTACLNGQCIAQPNGDYRCQCSLGYRVSADGRQCIPTEQLQTQPFYETEEPVQDPAYLPSFLFRRPSRRKNSNLERLESAEQWDQRQGVMMPAHLSNMWRLYSVVPTPCERPNVIKNCAGGFCLNLGGQSYQCECLPGYKSFFNNRLCKLSSDQTR